MRKQSGILRKQYAFLLAESTEIRKQLSILRKQYVFLLIRHLLKLIMRCPKFLVGTIHELCLRRFWHNTLGLEPQKIYCVGSFKFPSVGNLTFYRFWKTSLPYSELVLVNLPNMNSTILIATSEGFTIWAKSNR